MRKLTTIAVVVMAMFALGAAGAFACGENASNASADNATSKSCSASAKLASSSAASGKAACAAHASARLTDSDMKACAKKMGMTEEECRALCSSLGESAVAVMAKHNQYCKMEGGCELVNIRVNGMTCGGCESGVRAALSELDGVNGVLNVSYKDNIAQVCANSDKFSKYSAVKAVQDKGFKAEVIPAVATSATKTGGAKTTSSRKSCSAADKAACAAKKKAAEKSKESTSL